MSADSESNSKYEKSVDLLLWQYRECWNDVRNFNNLIWQIPSFTTIATGALTGLSTTATMSIRILLFIVALSLNFVMTIALYKHHFFRVSRLREIDQIENAFRSCELKPIADGASSTKTIQKKIEKGVLKDMPQGWVYNRIAIDWIKGYMHVLTIALVLGLILVISHVP
jgi:hypothetical protein